jgi:hypothetical protein
MKNKSISRNYLCLPRKIRIQAFLALAFTNQKELAIKIDKSEGLVSDVISDKTVSAPVEKEIYDYFCENIKDFKEACNSPKVLFY